MGGSRGEEDAIDDGPLHGDPVDAALERQGADDRRMGRRGGERQELEPAFNDLAQLRLGPFPREVAAQFTRSLVEGLGRAVPDDTLEHLLNRLGWYCPFHLQLLVSQLDPPSLSGAPVTPDHVEGAWQQLLHPRNRAYLDPWWDNLESLPTPPLARAVLGILAQQPGGLSPQRLAQEHQQVTAGPCHQQHLADTLWELTAAGYLEQSGPRYRVPSGLLREFFARRWGG